MTDLKSLIPSDTYTFDIKHPITNEVLVDKDKKPMTITVHSPYSDKFRHVAHEQAKKRINRSKSADADKELTIDDYQEFSLDTLAATTQDWNISFDGEEVPYSDVKAKEIYKMLPWLTEQVKEAQDKIANFIKP